VDLFPRLVIGIILVVAMQAVMEFFPSITGLARTTIIMVVAIGVPQVFFFFFEVRRRRISSLKPGPGTSS
jgi:hypothetical protein